MKSSIFKYLILTWGILPFFSFSQNQTRVIIKVGDKCGYADGAGRIVIPCQYDTCQEFKTTVAIVGKFASPDYKYAWNYGLIDENGDSILGTVFNSIYVTETKRIIANYRYNQRLYNFQGEKLFECDKCYLSFDPDFDRFFAQPYNSKFDGKDSVKIIDPAGKIIFKCPGTRIERPLLRSSQNDHVYRRTNWYRINNEVYSPMLKKKFGSVKLINPDGTIIMDSLSNSSTEITDNRFYIQKNGLTAVLDSLLQEVMPFSWGYETIADLQFYGVCFVKKNGLHGVVTEKNEIIIPLIYDRPLSRLPQSNAFRIHHEKKGDMILDYSGDTLVNFGYYVEGGFESSDFSKPVVLKDMKTYKSGLSDGHGGLSVPCKYDFLEQDTNGEIIFFSGDSAGILNSKAELKQLLPCKYISSITESCRACGFESKEANPNDYPLATNIITSEGSSTLLFKYLDSTGKPMTDFVFDRVGAFVDGLAGVYGGLLYFMIDKSGNPVKYQEKYVLVSNFASGFGVITENFQTFGLVNKAGEIVIPPDFQEIKLTEIMPKFHFVSQHGYESMPMYYFVPEISNQHVKVRKGDEWIEIPIH